MKNIKSGHRKKPEKLKMKSSKNSDDENDWDLSKMESIKRPLSDDENDAVPKKKNKIDKDLYKPPTADELNQLRETENLYHSNLFRLQIEEILNEVKLGEKYKKLFNSWFSTLKECINLIEETEEYKLNDESLLKTLDVKVPMFNLPKEEKGVFKFLKPTNINVIGSYAFETNINTNAIIDIAVEMSGNSFQKGDYQNFRFFRKQRLYLAHIASRIKEKIVGKMSYVGNNENVVLKIVPDGKLGKKCTIFLHIAAEENSFKLSRFLPDRNNIRPGWYFESGSNEESLTATPHYNSSVLRSLITLKTNEESKKLIKEYPNIRDGIILLKIWLCQRELIRGHNAFTGYVITMYVIYLLRTKKLNTFMSSYQIIRNVWNNLAQSNWSENGISLCEEKEGIGRINEFRKCYDCVFLDSTGYHNIAAGITKEMFSWIQNLAAASISSLDNGQVDSFQILFMRKVPLYRTFDNVICIHGTEALKNSVKLSSKEDMLNFGPNEYHSCVKLLVSTLKEGLGERLLNIFVLPEQFKEWEIVDDFPERLEKIFIGLNFNPEHFFDVITKGPEGNSSKASDFRKFWGAKSELHRFNDGSIHEVVVWGQGKTIEEKRCLTQKIILFLFQKKLSLPRSEFFYLGSQLENLLKLKKMKTDFDYGTGEEASLRVIQVYNSLEKELTSLTDMPLSITGISGSSAVLRYTEVFPPIANSAVKEINPSGKNDKYKLLKEKNLKKVPLYLQPIEVSIQLLTSGKWPDELEAIRCTKGAFQIQIAECLRKQYNLIAQGSLHYTDVFKDGYLFRLRIANQKEIALMKQQIGEDGIIKYRDTEESVELERRLFHLPTLTGALHGLHCQQPSFGPACCLAKRWLSSQLIDDSHFPDIVLELVMASIYLTPDPYKSAQVPQVAFFRLLELFARSHWTTDPIIVNFNNEMTREQIIAIENEFRISRESLPLLFISTPYDHRNSLWTKQAPNILILNRVHLMALEALKLLEGQILNSTLNYRGIFKTPLSEYDCLIHLKSVYNPRRYEAIEIDEKEVTIECRSYKKRQEQNIPVVDFNPIELYLKELRSNYSEFALFFHDTYGGKVIAVLLKPSVLETREESKVANFHFRKLNSKGQFVFDFSTMIENLYIIGKDVISAIDVQSKRVSIE